MNTSDALEEVANYSIATPAGQMAAGGQVPVFCDIYRHITYYIAENGGPPQLQGLKGAAPQLLKIL